MEGTALASPAGNRTRSDASTERVGVGATCCVRASVQCAVGSVCMHVCVAAVAAAQDDAVALRKELLEKNARVEMLEMECAQVGTLVYGSTRPCTQLAACVVLPAYAASASWYTWRTPLTRMCDRHARVAGRAGQPPTRCRRCRCGRGSARPTGGGGAAAAGERTRQNLACV